MINLSSYKCPCLITKYSIHFIEFNESRSFRSSSRKYYANWTSKMFLWNWKKRKIMKSLLKFEFFKFALKAKVDYQLEVSMDSFWSAFTIFWNGTERLSNGRVQKSNVPRPFHFLKRNSHGMVLFCCPPISWYLLGLGGLFPPASPHSQLYAFLTSAPRNE